MLHRPGPSRQGLGAGPRHCRRPYPFLRQRGNAPASACEIYFRCNVTLRHPWACRTFWQCRSRVRRALPHKAPQASPGSARPIPHGSAPCETALQVQARSEGAGRYIEAVSNAIPPGARNETSPFPGRAAVHHGRIAFRLHRRTAARRPAAPPPPSLRPVLIPGLIPGLMIDCLIAWLPDNDRPQGAIP